MKKLLVVILLIGTSVLRVIAQMDVPDSTKQVTKEEMKSVVESAKKEITNVLKSQIDSLKDFIIENQKDTSDLVGILNLTGQKVARYEKNNRAKVSAVFNPLDGSCGCDLKYFIPGRIDRKKNECTCEPLEYIVFDSIEVDKVVIRVESGEILHIQVFSNGLRFTNQRAPILLSSNRFAKRDLLREDRGKYFVVLNEILQYELRKSFFPDNDDFILDKRHRSRNLTKSSGINSVVDAKLYTDALGVFGGKSNGLVQTDISGRFAVGHMIFPQTGIRFLKYVGFGVTASKFDSKRGFTSKDSSFDRTNMFQKNWLNANIYTTIISGWLNKGSSDTWGVDIGPGFDLSQVADSSDTTTTISKYISGRLYFDFRLTETLVLNFSCMSLYHFNTLTEGINGQSRDKIFVIPQVSFTWSPKGKPNSRIFSRIRYATEWKDSKNEFVQVQFGYSMLFSDLTKKK